MRRKEVRLLASRQRQPEHPSPAAVEPLLQNLKEISRKKNGSEDRPENLTRNAWDKIRAAALGYKQRIPYNKLPFNSHGQPGYWNGRVFITRDVDAHNIENGWKMFDRRSERMGTFDSSLNPIKG